jgi:type IV pilus assembly protein PilQ
MNPNHHYNKFTLGFLWLVLLFFLLCGCAAKQKEKKDPFFNKWRLMAETSKGHSPGAKKHARPVSKKKFKTAPLKSKAAEVKKPLPTQKTTLEMYNTDVAVLLRALARAINQNIIINEKVKGKININVKEAPWNQIFLGVLRANGLTYGWEGDIIHIITLEDKEKTLKLLEAEEKIKSKKREIEMVAPLVTQIVNIDYTDASKLKKNLEMFLTERSEGKSLGSVMVDEHSNSLVIQAIPEDIESMIFLIDELDKPTPQILIEAHIVETSRQTARELGVQWGGLYYNSGTGSDKGAWLAPDINPATLPPEPGYVSNFPIDPTKAAIEGAGLTLGYLATIGNSILALQLTALEEEGKLEILSSPSITTLDNQTALIESGEEAPYQTVVDFEVNIQYKKAVLSLEVTPHVIEGEILKMKVKTKKDELDFSRTVLGNPTVITKLAETNVILFDGQTMVIGGLSKDKTGARESGVPVLKDIPLIGYLFKGTGDTKANEELLIFITPHILKERTFAKPLAQTAAPESKAAQGSGATMPHPKMSFAVQAGSFSNINDAYRLLANLRWKGYESYLFQAPNADGQMVYTVRIGDYEDLETASQTVSRFEKKEQATAVITHIDSLAVVTDQGFQ